MVTTKSVFLWKTRVHGHSDLARTSTFSTTRTKTRQRSHRNPVDA